MEKRSARVPEAREKTTELNCMWGLLSILQSCQGFTSPKLISNGRPGGRHVMDHPRKVEQLASFDEECRKIQNVDVTGAILNKSSRSARNLICEDFSVANDTEEIIAQEQHAKMNSPVVDDLVSTHKGARRKREKANRSSSFRLDNAADLSHLPPSSAEISLNRRTLAALLEAFSTQNDSEEDLHSEYFQRSLSLGEYNRTGPGNMSQDQMSARAFADQKFIGREFVCKHQGMKSKSKSFSNALEVLNSDKDRLMDLLPEPDSLQPRGSKNFCPSRTHRETIKSLLDAKLAEYKRENARTSGKPGSTLAFQKWKTNKHSVQGIDYQCSCSPQKSFAAQPTDKIVVLEPASQNAKIFDYVTCHCSSINSHRKLSRMISDAKSSSFSFRETKKKLKHAFGSPRKELNQCSVNGTSDAVALSKSSWEVGDDCIYCGADNMSSFSSSSYADTDGKLCSKQEPKCNRDFDVACNPDAVGKNPDFSSGNFSMKQEFDVILEAKRRLSERLKKLNDVEVARNEKSPSTLRRILASPEHDIWPLSPRRESQYCSGAAEMRFSPYLASLRAKESSSQQSNGRERASLSPIRPNTKMMPCDDYKSYDDSKKSSLISSHDEAGKAHICAMANKKSNGKPEFVETNGILEPESSNSKVSCEINTKDITAPMPMADPTVLHKDDDSVGHSLLDSLSENEAFTSMEDDFQSTPSSIYQLDVVDNVKYQEEHQSPVSVLEPFFMEDANSPHNGTLQTARRKLQPLRLDFQEHSVEPSPHNPPISASSCIEEQDHLFEYVYAVLQASCLDWDQLSKIPFPRELLHASLFDEVEYMPTDCYFDPKLLFDHINEVLIDIYWSHFCCCPSLSPIKPKTMSLPLVKIVFDETMTQADFYLRPQTEKRTLDQLVSKDVEKGRSWLDVRHDTAQIVVDISEDFLEECILDMLLESVT